MEYGRRRSVLGRVRFVGTAHGAHRLSWKVCDIEATLLGERVGRGRGIVLLAHYDFTAGG